MYSDDVDLEAQAPYTDYPEFEKLSDQVATGVFEINSQLAKLQSLLKAYSGGSVEERAVEGAEKVRQAFRVLSDPVKQLQAWPDAVAAQRFTQQKLSREFSTALGEFQDLQKVLAEKQRRSIIEAKTNIATAYERGGIEDRGDDDDGESGLGAGTGLTQAQAEAEALNAEQVAYQQTLIQERETEIQSIEQGISELNEIFTDLGTIVTEQGTIIDNIESNVYNIAEHTRDASTQLTKAARYQRSTRGRAFCLLIILIIVLGVILLAMFLG